MDKDSLMKYALIAGGAFAVYWYITNHGPSGAVYAADGVTKVNLSYWDTWFGTAATTTAPALPSPTATPAFHPVAVAPGTMPTGPSSNPAAVLPPAPPAMNLAQLTTAVLMASGANAQTQMSADQWNYYRNNIQPPALTPDQFSTLLSKLPAGVTRDAMTVDQFMNALYYSGVVPGLAGVSGLGRVGDIVPVMSRPSIPMMSFGGGLGGGYNAFSQKGKWTN